MKIILSVWTNIKDADKATSIFKTLLADSLFLQIKTETYWKDETKRVMTFQKDIDLNQNNICNLFNSLNLISTNWTFNTEGLCSHEIEIDGHSNDHFKHTSISFATIINADNQ